MPLIALIPVAVTVQLLGRWKTILGTVVFVVLPLAIAAIVGIWIDVRMLLLGVVSSVLAMGALFLAVRRESAEIVGLVVGLAYGGLLWLIVPLMVNSLPGSHEAILTFMRGHAFDYFGAGGLVAAVWYVSLRKTGPRLIWLGLIMALVAVVTAFSADASLGVVAVTGIVGGAAGALLGAVPVPDYVIAAREAGPIISARLHSQALPTNPSGS